MYQLDLPELERMLNELCKGKDARNIVAIEDALIKFFPMKDTRIAVLDW